MSAAIRLAHAGFRVTILEKQDKPGGKLQRIEKDGYRFDRGPSTITMPHLFEQVFEHVGRRMGDYVTMHRLEAATRNIFADGHVVDLTSSYEATMSQIAEYSPEDAAAFPAFREEAMRLYQLAEERFLGKLMLRFRDKLSPQMAAGFMRVKPFTTLQQLLLRYFRHPNTLAMFGRYATYVGSSPYLSPAIFAMLAHVESDLGIYRVEGGTYSIVEAFVQLARELGVTIHTDTAVHEIVVMNGKVTGVESSAGSIPADLVLANGDVLSIYDKLIPPAHRPSVPNRQIERYEPSLSGFVQLIGVQRSYSQLLHHTVYYPERYEAEFRQIFTELRPPEDPAIYICNGAVSEPGSAPPGGSSLFILVNAPYLSTRWDWEQEEDRYGDLILSKLESRGLPGLRQAEVRIGYTPSKLQADTFAHRGSIYGISSNSARQTFFRPVNRSRDIEGLWFVGGTTHPGGGTPIVTQSGQLVAQHVIEQYGT